MLSLYVLYETKTEVCDSPLRLWLWGSIVLGFPADLAVKTFAWCNRPRFKRYRLKVLKLRGGGEGAGRISKVILYDEFGELFNDPLSPNELNVEDFEIHDESSCYLISFPKWPEVVAGYRIESKGEQPQLDLVEWELAGTNDMSFGAEKDEEAWTVLHLVDKDGARLLDTNIEATDLVDQSVAFRQAFFLEVLQNCAAFAWLVAGTSWVAASSETCIDSSPTLWYYTFFTSVITWSGLGTMSTGLIVSAVAMIILGVKAAPPPPPQ